jgi:hypothetical protein
MKQIYFKKRFIAPILEGTKTQTIRRVKRRQASFDGMRDQYAPGEAIAAICQYHKPPFAILNVVGSEVIRFASLDEADATADGFTNLAELREALLELLPDAEHVDLLRIRFALEVPK